MSLDYHLMTMEAIAAIPQNGRKVVSTFSGAGGSCLGYRMSGYDVLWASEFIPAAQEVYKLNHPDSYLDTRDIREVKPADILNQTGLSVGELDLLDGSPPCASFSTSGNRHEGWGEEKSYSDTTQRVDDLFFEYIRILRGLKPKVFIAENVSGLIKGTAKGYFKMILADLKASGYRVSAKLLNAKYLGVPQFRERLIFIGVRDDLHIDPVHPSPLPFVYKLIDAIPEKIIEGDAWWLPEGKMMWLWENAHKNPKHHGEFKYNHMRKWGKQAFFNHKRLYWHKPAHTIVQGSNSLYHPDLPRTLTIGELKRIQSLPDDFQITGSFAKQWERIGRMVPPVMMARISQTVEQEILSQCAVS